MNEPKTSYNFHQPGNEFRSALRSKFKYAQSFNDIEKEEEFSKYQRIDRVFIAKYGCRRCPHVGTSLCPYGVGRARKEEKSYICKIYEKFGEAKDWKGKFDYSSGEKAFVKGSQVINDNEVIVIANEYKDGICPERTREMAFWAKNMNDPNGLLIERAENMAKLKDLIATFSNEAAKLGDSSLTFNTSDGDTKLKTILIQLQDSLVRNDQFIANAINQQLKFEELKQRDREGPRVIDVAALEAQIHKTLGTEKQDDTKESK